MDYRRLGKQRVEAMQLINIQEGRTKTWSNHPASRMWDGYVDALKSYCNHMIVEWKNRGYNNTMKFYSLTSPVYFPPWMKDEAFHASHRAALLYKDYEYYKQFGWVEKPELNYVWPI